MATMRDHARDVRFTAPVEPVLALRAQHVIGGLLRCAERDTSCNGNRIRIRPFDVTEPPVHAARNVMAVPQRCSLPAKSADVIFHERTPLVFVPFLPFLACRRISACRVRKES